MQERSGVSLSEGQDSLPTYDLLYGEIDLKEEIGDLGLRLIVPTTYLFGRQRPDEYSDKKRRQIEAVLSSKGIDYLLQNPVIVCALFRNDVLTLAVIDGHHRIRYSAKQGIRRIPCLITTPETLAPIFNKHNKEKTTPELLTEQFSTDIHQAINELISRYPHYKPSIPILGASNLGQLKAQFPSFN